MAITPFSPLQLVLLDFCYAFPLPTFSQVGIFISISFSDLVVMLLLAVIAAWFFVTVLPLLLYPLFRIYFRFLVCLAVDAPLLLLTRLAFRLNIRASFPLFPRPSTPGGCWATAFPDSRLSRVYSGLSPSLAFDLLALADPSFLEGWIDRSQLRQVSFGHLVRLRRINRHVYHVLPLLSSCPHSRVYTRRALPDAWYGSGPDMFDGSALQSTVLANHLSDYTKMVNRNRVACPQAVPRHMLRHLDRAGIPHPAPFSPAGTHPVHAAFRALNTNIAAHIVAGHQWYGLWLKNERVNEMLKVPRVSPPVGRFNPPYSGKHITQFRGECLPGSTAPISTAPVWYAHNTLHHLTPRSVGSFFDTNPTLRYLVADAVIPPETLWDLSPQNEQLYTFKCVGDTLLYYPEGDVNHYEQPFSARAWLRANKIVSPRGECLHVALVHTVGSHHSFVISRPQFVPQRFRTYDLPDLCAIPAMAHPFGSLDQRLTRPGLLHNLTAFTHRTRAD